ncbi:MAG: hypothetical protein ACRDUY_15620 [Nitriliruptorales bacterium]
MEALPFIVVALLVIELAGDRFLVATDRLPPEGLWDLLGLSRGFRQHVPSVVTSLHPGAEAETS